MNPRPFVPPRHGTEPQDRPNRLAEMVEIAELLGTPLMPHQQLICAVGSECDPDTGIPAYSDVIATMHRRGGKTVDLLVFTLERALLRPTAQRIVYTAQTGQDSRKKILGEEQEEDAFVPMLQASPLLWSSVRKVRRTPGAEGINFRTGSFLDSQATTSASGHGRLIHLGIIDEAWADDDDRREQSMGPAMLTVDDAQLLIRSTSGTEESLYLARKIEQGRRAVAEGATSGIAYFEWSFPEGCDLDDEDIWWENMPALGRTISVDAVRALRRRLADDDFARSVGNMQTRANTRVIPEPNWDAVTSPKVAPKGSRLVIGADATPLGTAASIVVCDQLATAELIDHREGTLWVEDRLRVLADTHEATVVVDSVGPLAGLTGDHIVKLDTATAAMYTQHVYERIVDGHLRVRQHGALDAAAAAAGRRYVENRWFWARRNETDISPLVALTWAVGHATRPIDETEEALPPFAFG